MTIETIKKALEDLDALVTIVAKDTGALFMSDPDEESVGSTLEGDLEMTFGHVRRAHAALSALEAALSTDAEPDGWISEDEFTLEKENADEWKDDGLEPKPFYFAPPAPSVAVKALEWDGNGAQTPFGAYTVGENVDDRFQWTFHSYPYGSPDDLEHPDAESAQAAAQADYQARIRAALSAQVQGEAEITAKQATS